MCSLLILLTLAFTYVVPSNSCCNGKSKHCSSFEAITHSHVCQKIKSCHWKCPEISAVTAANPNLLKHQKIYQKGDKISETEHPHSPKQRKSIRSKKSLVTKILTYDLKGNIDIIHLNTDFISKMATLHKTRKQPTTKKKHLKRRLLGVDIMTFVNRESDGPHTYDQYPYKATGRLTSMKWVEAEQIYEPFVGGASVVGSITELDGVVYDYMFTAGHNIWWYDETISEEDQKRQLCRNFKFVRMQDPSVFGHPTGDVVYDTQDLVRVWVPFYLDESHEWALTEDGFGMDWAIIKFRKSSPTVTPNLILTENSLEHVEGIMAAYDKRDPMYAFEMQTMTTTIQEHEYTLYKARHLDLVGGMSGSPFVLKVNPRKQIAVYVGHDRADDSHMWMRITGVDIIYCAGAIITGRWDLIHDFEQRDIIWDGVQPPQRPHVPRQRTLPAGYEGWDWLMSDTDEESGSGSGSAKQLNEYSNDFIVYDNYDNDQYYDQYYDFDVDDVINVKTALLHSVNNNLIIYGAFLIILTAATCGCICFICGLILSFGILRTYKY